MEAMEENPNSQGNGATPSEPLPLDLSGAGAGPGILAGGAAVPPPDPYAHLPQDLRVPWTWLDLLLFFFFAAGCLVVTARVFVVVATLVAGPQSVSGGQLTIPTSWGVMVQMIWYAVLVGYLYLMVRLRFRTAFWETLGFRRTKEIGGAGMFAGFAVTGMLLAVMISALAGLVRPVGEIPMEKLFQQRNTAALVLFAAVVVAPLVEELLFRGWLYPVVARTFGVAGGVLITGALFGLVHGAQLGWHMSLVGLLTIAGVVFTYFRARTGSVLPSYFLHLGYNCIPVIGFLLQTSGLQNLPTPGQ